MKNSKQPNKSNNKMMNDKKIMHKMPNGKTMSNKEMEKMIKNKHK